MKIAAHTLGCKLNYAETSDTLRRLAALGNEIVDFGEVADMYIINTCTVTAVAEKKCRNAIRQAVAQNPDAKVVVIGCYADAERNAVAAIPGVTHVLGNDVKHMLPDLVRSDFNPSVLDSEVPAFKLQYSSGDRTRVFFKIQDGCDYFCTYCAIPLARGRSRSANIEETLCAARHIAARHAAENGGALEVVLTGVNTGTFGQHHNESLIDLLRGLDAIEGVARYRISSIEPNLLTDEMVEFIASSRAFLPHFHIPLQAGSDHVLQMMHRRYDTELYRRKLLTIKQYMPDACIAADVMAGFNGESEEEFAKVMDYIESLPISYLHVFTYSDRPGTAALRMGEKIPMHTRREHTARLLELSEHKHKAFAESQMGMCRPVLWESSNHDGTMQGWTDNYIRLSRPYDEHRVGTIEQVTITTNNIVYER